MTDQVNLKAAKVLSSEDRKSLLRVALRYGALLVDIEPEDIKMDAGISKEVSAFLLSLSEKGYVADEKLLRALCSLPATEDLLNEITEVIDSALGIGLNWAPLVKGWDVPTGESFLDHCITFYANFFQGSMSGTTLPCGHLIPDGTFPLERYNGCPFCGTPFKTSDVIFTGQGTKKKELGLKTLQDLESLQHSFLKSTVPLDATQIASLKDLTEVFGVDDSVFIAMKETRMVVSDALLAKAFASGSDDLTMKAGAYFTSPADILRYLWYKKTVWMGRSGMMKFLDKKKSDIVLAYCFASRRQRREIPKFHECYMLVLSILKKDARIEEMDRQIEEMDRQIEELKKSRPEEAVPLPCPVVDQEQVLLPQAHLHVQVVRGHLHAGDLRFMFPEIGRERHEDEIARRVVDEDLPRRQEEEGGVVAAEEIPALVWFMENIVARHEEMVPLEGVHAVIGFAFLVPIEPQGIFVHPLHPGQRDAIRRQGEGAPQGEIRQIVFFHFAPAQDVQEVSAGRKIGDRRAGIDLRHERAVRVQHDDLFAGGVRQEQQIVCDVEARVLRERDRSRQAERFYFHAGVQILRGGLLPEGFAEIHLRDAVRGAGDQEEQAGQDGYRFFHGVGF